MCSKTEDYDVLCVPLYKDFLKEKEVLQRAQYEGDLLCFARSLQNIIQIQTDVENMSGLAQEEGKFFVFDKLYEEITSYTELLYKKLPKSNFA